MTNADPGWVLVEEILGAIAREYDWPLEEGGRIGYFDQPRRAVQLEQHDWVGHLGEYEVRQGYHVRLIDDAGLALQTPGQPALSLVPTSSTEFHAEALDLELTFKQDDTGRTVGLILRQNGSNLAAQRLD